MEINTIKKFKYKGFDCIVKRIGYSKGQSARDTINLLGDDDFSMRRWNGVRIRRRGRYYSITCGRVFS